MRSSIFEAASILTESVHPKVEEAERILGGDRKTALVIQKLDPYDDYRMTPVIATWLKDKEITAIDEHIDDLKEYKRLRSIIKKADKARLNPDDKKEIKRLLDFEKDRSSYPMVFEFQAWIRDARVFLNETQDFSDDGLPVKMETKDHIVYKINKPEHCQVPIVKNAMSNRWCVTGSYYGSYGGPPYYAVVRKATKEPIAMLISRYLKTDPEQAIRNADNSGMVSKDVKREILPIIKKIMPKGYVKWIDSEPKYEELEQAIEEGSRTKALAFFREWKVDLDDINDKALRKKLVDFVLASSPKEAINFAYFLHPLPEAEPIIAKGVDESVQYARFIIKRRFPIAEEKHYEDIRFVLDYTGALREIYNEKDIPPSKTRYPKGEDTLLKYGGQRDLFLYAAHNMQERWKEAEPKIAKNAKSAMEYFHHFHKEMGSFPEAEDAIFNSDNMNIPFAYSKLSGKPISPDRLKKIVGSGKSFSELTFSGYVIDRWIDGDDPLPEDKELRMAIVNSFIRIQTMVNEKIGKAQMGKMAKLLEDMQDQLKEKFLKSNMDFNIYRFLKEVALRAGRRVKNLEPLFIWALENDTLRMNSEAGIDQFAVGKYAVDFGLGPKEWPELYSFLLSNNFNPQLIYQYASLVMKAPWPEGSKADKALSGGDNHWSKEYLRLKEKKAKS